MIRFRTLAVAGAVTLGLGGALLTAPLSPAGAAGDPYIGMQVLDMLCRSKAGTAYDTPYTISRCQEARANENFEVEQLICEGLLDGTFRSVTTTGRPSRVNWFCFHGPITP